MVQKFITSFPNVIDFAHYQLSRGGGKVGAIALRACRHCGAALLDGESEDECSSALNFEAAEVREAACVD
jgi:hypothetical protein